MRTVALQVFLLCACSTLAPHGWRIGLVRTKKSKNSQSSAGISDIVSNSSSGLRPPVQALGALLFASRPHITRARPPILRSHHSNIARRIARHAAPRMGSGNLESVVTRLGQLGVPVQGLLDKYAQVRFDDATGKEYWVMNSGLEILRKDESMTEIVLGGLAAGIVVEFLVAFLCYPFDTVKTRLQADQKEPLEDYPVYDRLYDGFGAVVFEVPALAFFWATRDIIRTTIFRTITGLPLPWTDAVATGLGSILGEALVFLLFVTPSEVFKTQRQASVLEEVEEKVRQERENSFIGWLQGLRGNHTSSAQNSLQFTQQVLNAFPVLAFVDVTYVGLRVLFFIALHDSGLIQAGVAEDALVFIIANIAAVALTTPLDVVRTRMLLGSSTIQEFPAIVDDIYKEGGIRGFTAGWIPRFLYNGIVVGLVLGFVRQGYAGIRASFFIDILDRLEAVDLANFHLDVATVSGILLSTLKLA